jgi:hypothetical protein
MNDFLERERERRGGGRIHLPWTDPVGWIAATEKFFEENEIHPCDKLSGLSLALILSTAWKDLYHKEK